MGEIDPLAVDNVGDDIEKESSKEADDLETARYPCAWYEREFRVPPGPAGRQFLLRFPAGAKVGSETWHGIERASDVYVNGRFAGSVRNTKKVLEISDRVSLNETNRISILNGRPWLAAAGAAGFTESPILEIVKPSDVMLGEPLIIPKVRDQQLAVRLQMKNGSKRNIPIRFKAEIIDARTRTKLAVGATELLSL
ncbi:MAG: hypothetical protein QF886_27280, partial [Planctomycetota bacterium]|nr:hypothetical protein [Planctomycetota bacterium]